MSALTPLALVDDFLLNYSVGQALLLAFLLSLPVGIVKQSRRLLSINTILFGVLFAIVPSIGGGSILFAFLGIGLLVIGPVLYMTADR